MKEYTKIFDSSCNAWTNDVDWNLMFIQANLARMDQIVKARGHVFLNEVYDALGFSRTKSGQCAGWSGNKDIKADYKVFKKGSIIVVYFLNVEEDILHCLE